MKPFISPPRTQACGQSCVPSSARLCRLAGARALEWARCLPGRPRRCFWGLRGVQGGCAKCDCSLLLSPCWLEDAGRAMALPWQPSKAMAPACVHSPPATAPSARLSHVSLSKTSNVGLVFSPPFLFKWPLFTLFHAFPPWHAGRRGEGAFSQALHHMSLVFCALFFPHRCPCQGKDIV